MPSIPALVAVLTDMSWADLVDHDDHGIFGELQPEEGPRLVALVILRIKHFSGHAYTFPLRCRFLSTRHSDRRPAHETVHYGHHRVALARERGADYIDAQVTRLESEYEIPPDTDVAQLVHTELQRRLLDASGLSRARPDAVIEFTFADGYTQLAEIISARGYELARRAGELPSREQVAADWYETVYVAGLDAVRRARLPELYASWNSTEADLFLWVYKIRRDLRARDASVDFDAAATHAREGTSASKPPRARSG